MTYAFNKEVKFEQAKHRGKTKWKLRRMLPKYQRVPGLAECERGLEKGTFLQLSQETLC